MKKETIWWGLGITAVVGAIGVGLYFRLRNHPETVKSTDDELEDKKDNEHFILTTHAPEEKPDLLEYAERLRQTNYVTFFDDKKEETTTINLPNNYPDIFRLRPEEFGEYEEEGYENISLIFFDGDKILVDDENRKLSEDDIAIAIGLDEWREIQTNPMAFVDDEIIYIRNNTLRHDYEIALDYRSYEDVVDYPDSSEDE